MPSQKNADIIFLNIAQEISKLSNCISVNVGCVIVNDGRIITMGYNGSIKGFTNCNEKFADIKPRFGSEPFTPEERQRHHEWSTNFEIHGEMNALIFAARHGIAIDGATLYCTTQPCHNCLKNLLASGIHRIVYANAYDKANYTEETKLLIETSKVEVLQLTR